MTEYSHKIIYYYLYIINLHATFVKKAIIILMFG